MARASRVLIVDDSPIMQRAIARMLGGSDDMVVAGVAGNGREGLALAAELSPDVMILDLEMPVLDGLGTLAELAGRPGPRVIVLSGHTAVGSEAALRALELGAFDFVPKPTSGLVDVYSVATELREKIRAATQREAAPRTPAGPPDLRALPRQIRAIVIGISTGGPPALQQLLPSLPANFGIPVVVVQHMPPGFTQTLAERLDRMCAVAVREAVDGESLAAGAVLIAPAGHHLRLTATGRVQLVDQLDVHAWHKPCADALFTSAAHSFGPHALGVVMTGMGCDGTAGARALEAAGAEVWAQDEASCTIYGMPRSVVEAGLANRVLPLSRLGAQLARLAA